MSDPTCRGYFRFLSYETRERLKHEYQFDGQGFAANDLSRMRAAGDFALAAQVVSEIERSQEEDRWHRARVEAANNSPVQMYRDDPDTVPDAIARLFLS